MDKIAAEKIASDYFNAGVQLALANAGITKTANKKTLLSLLGGAGLGAGVSAVPAAMELRAVNQGVDQLFKGLNKGMSAVDEMAARMRPGIALPGPGSAGGAASQNMEFLNKLIAENPSAYKVRNLGTFEGPPSFLMPSPRPMAQAMEKIRATGAGPGIALPGSGSAGGAASQNMEYLNKLIGQNPPLVGPPSNLAEALTQSQMAEILEQATKL